MSNNILNELNTEKLREGFLKYTRKAFQMLPKIDSPSILDIGCGTGIPTIELAKLSEGDIIGIDIDQDALDKLNLKIEKRGLSSRVKTLNCSILELDFPDESFDVIWAEGVIKFIGFERALKEWYKMLKSNGFIVLHDDISSKEKKLNLIPQFGYILISHFQLPDDAWWADYYEPLEKRIKELCNKYNDDPKVLEAFQSNQNEIITYKKNPKAFHSIFYILKKAKQ